LYTVNTVTFNKPTNKQSIKMFDRGEFINKYPYDVVEITCP
jgi:hypothetical protein